MSPVPEIQQKKEDKPQEETKKAKKEAKPEKKKEVKAEPTPKEQKKEAKKTKESEYNPWDTLLFPHLAEKSMNMVEVQNLLTFIVNKRSTKDDIREAVEKGFQVSVKNINTEITRKGVKKAYVTLSPKDSAADIATRLGMI